ncbi:MAG: FAD-binding oxidoreductase [Candidatus Xenobia bacterium]
MSYTVESREPREVWVPGSPVEIARLVQRAAEEKLAVVPWGGGTHQGLGYALTGYDVALSTARLNRLVAHEPYDLTVTVEAGMTLAELDSVLAKHGQRLPCEVPHPERATVGGMLASNASGPMRHSFGTPRDLVLGMKMVLSGGQEVKGGGRVVKNVSGYDVVRLFVGSLGTLGVIFEASFKVLPRPRHRRVLRIDGDCLDTLTSADFSLAFLELFWDGQPHLYVGLEGEKKLVESQAKRLRDAVEDDAYAWLRDLPHDHPAPVVLKASIMPSDVLELLRTLPPGAQALASAGVGVVRLFVSPETVPALADTVQRMGGTLVWERAPAALREQISLREFLGDSRPLMQQIKEAVDPAAIFSPGRLP